MHLKKPIHLTPLENGRSKSLEMCRKYLGKTVNIVIDQPYGTTSPYGIIYEANYGYVPNTVAPDGDALDAYYLGSREPLETASGVCVGIVHRLEDDDDKLVLVPAGVVLSDSDIEAAVNFSEQYFKHTIILE